MPILDWHIEEATQAIKDRLQNAMTVVGALGVFWASDKLRENGSVVTSNLINSIAYSTSTVQSDPAKPGATNGTKLQVADEELSVRIGTNVVYAARVEFGFVGKDSLGRTYNQQAKSYLRVALTTNKNKIEKILSKAAYG